LTVTVPLLSVTVTVACAAGVDAEGVAAELAHPVRRMARAAAGASARPTRRFMDLPTIELRVALVRIT
jgi:hypothetical protein